MVAMATTGGGRGRTWRVGELAAACGLSVRTLHHYDQVGLLRASSRNGAGHRRYADEDVRRLHQIVTLRGFGFSLAEIARVLNGDSAQPEELVRHQLRQVQARIAAAERLRRQLTEVLDGLAGAREPSPRTLLALMEGTIDMNTPMAPEEFDELLQERQRWAEGLTPEQLTEFERRRQQSAAELSEAELQQMREHREVMRPDSRR